MKEIQLTRDKLARDVLAGDTACLDALPHCDGHEYYRPMCEACNVAVIATPTQAHLPPAISRSEWVDAQPSREELISALEALVEPRVGGDKKAQLARAKQNARKILERTKVP